MEDYKSLSPSYKLRYRLAQIGVLCTPLTLIGKFFFDYGWFVAFSPILIVFVVNLNIAAFED